MIAQSSNKVLFIVGPTATGKTSLADELAQKFNGELISADSRQVYKGLDIVTGKDIPRAPIHGLDLIKPGEDWNVFHFADFATKKINELQKQAKLPVVVGGTGLYVNSILKPLDIHIPPNPKLRAELEALSLTELQKQLKKVNSKHFKQMNYSDQNNPRRLIRAIEVSTSRHPELARSAKRSSPSVIPTVAEESLLEHPKLDALIIGLKASLDVTEDRIKKRVIHRLAQNARHELEYLKKLSPNWRSSPATSLGYKELDRYYSGQIDKKELINLWTIHERQYAKRQLTWFKKQPKINWFDITKSAYQEKIVDLVHNWYTESALNS